MNITYEKKDAMTFIGYHTEIRPEEGYQKCPIAITRFPLPLHPPMLDEVQALIEHKE